MKIITLIPMFAALWVQAQEKVNNVHAEPVKLTTEISSKKVQIRISPDITANNSNGDDTTTTINNSSKGLVPDREFVNLNKSNNSIKKAAKSESYNNNEKRGFGQ